ncbi:MAG: ATP-binding protein [Candidatus Eisenbacteria bacterium]
MDGTKVLVIDDDPKLLTFLSDFLIAEGAVPLTAADGRRGVDLATEETPAVALIDLKLSDMSGLDVIRRVREHSPATECILMTGHASQESAIDAVNMGAYSYIEKPYDTKQLVSVVRRAAEKHQTEKALRESEEQAQAILNASTDVALLVDTKGSVVAVNDAASRVIGRPKNEIIGKKVSEIHEPDVARRRTARAEDVITSGKPVRFEDQEHGRWFDQKICPVFDAAGKVRRLAVIARDITEQKRAERRMEGLNRLKENLLGPNNLGPKLRLITDSVVDIFDADFARIWLAKPGDMCDSGCFHAGPADEPHVCRSHERCLHLATSSGRYTHTDGDMHRRVPFGCYNIGLIASGKYARFITNNVTADPRVHDHEWAKKLGLVSFAGFRLLSETGEPMGVLAVFASHPIYSEEAAHLDNIAGTAAQVIYTSTAEEALRKSERELAIRNRVNEIFLTVSDEDMYGEVLRVILEAMASECGVFGHLDEDGALVVPTMTEEAWDGCRVTDKRFVFPRDTWGDTSWCRCIRDKQPVYSNQPSGKTPDGHVAMRRHISLPIVHQNETIGLIQVANKESDYDRIDLNLLEVIGKHIAPILKARLQRDRLARKRQQAEERLKVANLELERSNSELEQFAYVASHDLKEPLRMVASYVQLLERRYGKLLDGDATDFIGYAADGAKRMKGLIDGLLDYSCIGRQGRPFEPTDCESVIREVLRDLKVAIDETQAEVTYADLPVVTADEKQLVRVFQNLIGNAIKFHGERNPRIHISAERRDDEWVFSVADEGIGVDPESKDRIFVIFQQLHARDEYPGTGMGLAICKKIVERHGGRIHVESAPGEGSTFYFTIPFSKAELPAPTSSEIGMPVRT